MRLWESKKFVSELAEFYHTESLSLEHCRAMLASMKSQEPMSEGKVNRWLGWMQASCVAAGCATLEDMKQINRRCAG